MHAAALAAVFAILAAGCFSQPIRVHRPALAAPAEARTRVIQPDYKDSVVPMQGAYARLGTTVWEYRPLTVVANNCSGGMRLLLRSDGTAEFMSAGMFPTGACAWHTSGTWHAHS